LKVNELALLGWTGVPKKRGLNLKACLQKLLKTHVEKMSVYSPEQMLLKTKRVKISSNYVDENTIGYQKSATNGAKSRTFEVWTQSSQPLKPSTARK
jgi:hypothetical protein